MKTLLNNFNFNFREFFFFILKMKKILKQIVFALGKHPYLCVVIIDPKLIVNAQLDYSFIFAEKIAEITAGIRANKHMNLDLALYLKLHLFKSYHATIGASTLSVPGKHFDSSRGIEYTFRDYDLTAGLGATLYKTMYGNKDLCVVIWWGTTISHQVRQNLFPGGHVPPNRRLTSFNAYQTKTSGQLSVRLSGRGTDKSLTELYCRCEFNHLTRRSGIMIGVNLGDMLFDEFY